MPFVRRIILAPLVAASLLAGHPARALDLADDPLHACDRAAAGAEREWNLPNGLLAAIGVVESGRSGLGVATTVPWPWSINAEGWSYAAPSKVAAVSTVRALQARGLRTIDVGCFQVDLFYHPTAFRSLEEAFDPSANARAAARILTQARFVSAGWDQAIALYHSASLLRGAWYMQKVHAAWPASRTRLAAFATGAGPMPGYVVMMSEQAKLVRIITPADPQPVLAGLPRVITPADVPGIARLDGTPATEPVGNLPRVIQPQKQPAGAGGVLIPMRPAGL